MDTKKIQVILETEKETLISQLSELGQINPSNPGDWEAKPDNIDNERSDKIDVADNVEKFESNNAILNELEIRLVNVNAALDRIKNDSFGTCKVCKNPIEEDRLGANPAAETCKEHMNG